VRSLAGRLLTAALGCAVLAGAGPGAVDDDLHILRELRPAQRENVVVVQRNGSIRLVAYDPVVQGPQVAALAPLGSSTSHHFAVAQVRDRHVPQRHAVVAHVHVHPAKAAAAPIRVARVEPVSPGWLAAQDIRAFVPTEAVPKPVARPVVAEKRVDLAWLYRHRFDTKNDGSAMPGVPVRSQVGSPFDIDSGAFHGVRALNGWSAIRVSVSIPCGARHFVTGPGFNEVTGAPGIVDQETGYIYIGGWGAGPNGVSVDAGLQKSSAQAEHDDYAFYWKYASNKPVTSVERFPCGGPDVVLELYPVAESLLVFSATGIADDGERHTFTAVQHTQPNDGWSPDGGSHDDGIILKRIVSIAQPYTWHRRSGIGKANRFTSGSYFGVASPQDLTPRIVWSHCEIGHVLPPSILPQYHAWTPSQTWTSPLPGVYTDWPPQGVMRSNDGACDATGLYLRA
jgi:hypothetical protein